MSTVKVDTIKPVTSGAALSLQGDSGGAAVDCLNIDSSGDIDFSGNTNAKIKLPSAGGIYESDGSTAILTESGGVVTLGNVIFPAGHVLQVTTQFFGEAFTQDIEGGTPEFINNGTADWSVSITPSAVSAGLTTKFLCMFTIGRFAPNDTGGAQALGLILNRTTATVSTDIGISTESSNVPKCTWSANAASMTYSPAFHGSFMDSLTVPSTPVAIVYKVKMLAHSGGTHTTTINRGPGVATSGTEAYEAVTGSSWTVMEIK